MLAKVDRTCTELLQGNENALARVFQVEELRELDAYVLLGDAGSGKTFIFKNEAAMPECAYVSARNFMTQAIRPEWRGKTVFIDGLDETRAGGRDGRAPLDEIRSRLEKIAEPNRPRFRISCRQADWLGASDRSSLEYVAPGNTIRVFRIDPLTDEQILDMLAGRQIQGTPEEFLQSARGHSLEALLQNPQTLLLLMEAVGTSGWPESREEVFRLACEKLITEPNTEHQAASRRTAPSKPTLLKAAGYLSTVQLIADIAAFSVGDCAIHGVIALSEIPWKDLPLSDAVHTRVFSAIGEGLFSPVHRSVAEYLGASFLAGAVSAGLPIRRVRALIQGSDGGVVAGLRGLHAWLAFHLPEHRLSLCEGDPLGVTLYGAVGSFTPDEKRRLLETLASEIERSDGHALGDWNTPPAIALVTSDMAEAFKAILESPSRLLKDQRLSTFVLDAIANGTPLRELGPTLLAVVRDSSCWPSVRQRSLRAYIHVEPAHADALLQLAIDIQIGQLEDADDELLGEILSNLFPTHIGPAMVLDFLHPRKNRNLIGRYHMFWSHGVLERLGPEDAPILLDALAARTDLWHERPPDLMLRRLVSSVLAKGLLSHGDLISADRLFSWLAIPSDDHFGVHLDNSDRTTIRNWIEARPEIYRKLLLVTIQRVRALGNYRRSYFEVRTRFCGATEPPGMAEFWLELAEKESNAEFADFLFRQAVHPFFQEGNTEHSIEYFESWVEERPAFASVLATERYEEIPEWRQEDTERRKSWELEEESRRQKWISHFREELMKESTPHPGALLDVARAYFGHLLEAEGDSPRERLAHLLGNDGELVDASLSALVRTLERSDLPRVEEILDLAAKDRMHLVRLPCLAGMEEIWKTGPASVGVLRDETLSKIVAFRYTEGTGDDSDWLKHLVRDRPELVAPVLVAYAARMLRAGKEHIHGLWQLPFETDYSAVARLATLQLLAAFPTRLKKGQAASLEYVLKSALQHCDRNDLRKTVARRLRNSSLDVAQRVYWLACSLIVDPRKHEKSIERYIDGNHERREHLGEFLTGREDRIVLPQDTLPSTLSLLIRLLGPGCTSNRPGEAHWVTPAMRTAEVVSALINRLSSSADASATLELERLQDAPALSEWRSHLRRAAFVQQISRREASFRHPTPAQVQETLGRNHPANAADLAAIVLDTLEDLAVENRHGNVDGYKSYWNVVRSRPDRPKPEEECRNVLLSQLRPRLKSLGIDVQPEALHADGKRADIKVTYTSRNFIASVPIEIKKDSDPALWRAISNQLVPRYTRDPSTSGYGIYLVLWFGDRGMPHPPIGKKPRTAEDLRQRLEATIESDRRSLISVVVFDCAAPISVSRSR